MANSDKRKYTQREIDTMINWIVNSEVLESPEDCERIRDTVRTHRGITISVPASHRFWRTRSGWYDANWLTIAEGERGDKDILQSWDKFVDDWHADEE